MTLTNLFLILKGGARSGNRGHAGRPGKRGGSALSVSADLKSAFQDYTQLVDFDKKKLLEKLDSDEMKKLAEYTQKKLGKDLYVSYRTQNLFEYQLEKGFEINRGDVSSWTTGEGPREYKNYQYEVFVKMPLNKVLAAADVTPELFNHPYEREVITRKTNLRVTSVIKDTDDMGQIIPPIRVRAEVI